jgi:hypothetical protein
VKCLALVVGSNKQSTSVLYAREETYIKCTLYKLLSPSGIWTQFLHPSMLFSSSGDAWELLCLVFHRLLIAFFQSSFQETKLRGGASKIVQDNPVPKEINQVPEMWRRCDKTLSIHCKGQSVNKEKRADPWEARISISRTLQVHNILK